MAEKKSLFFPTNSFLLHLFPSTFLIGAVNLFLAWSRGLSYPRGEKCIIGTQSLCAYTYFRKKGGRAKTNNFASTHRFSRSRVSHSGLRRRLSQQGHPAGERGVFIFDISPQKHYIKFYAGRGRRVQRPCIHHRKLNWSYLFFIWKF